jgi:hypothetical protein
VWRASGIRARTATFHSLYTIALDDVIARYDLRYHAYADDAQTYGGCKLSESDALRVKMLDCINDVNGWMASNHLKLNPPKTEFLWCSTRGMTNHVDYLKPFVVDGATILL